MYMINNSDNNTNTNKHAIYIYITNGRKHVAARSARTLFRQWHPDKRRDDPELATRVSETELDLRNVPAATGMRFQWLQTFKD